MQGLNLKLRKEEVVIIMVLCAESLILSPSPITSPHACRCQEWRDEGLSGTGAQLDDLTLREWDQWHPS